MCVNIYIYIYIYTHTHTHTHIWVSLIAETVKNLPVMWETSVQSRSWEDPLEVGMATYSSILAWRIPMGRGAW